MARIAIAGNPNAGKSSIFNRLTGATQRVGNYPGVTVERKEGTLRRRGREITVVDLPGTYSLTAYSQEEIVARDFIIEEQPDVVVDVVDASNLERNLYLTVQIMEMGAPLVIALNMVDLAGKQGLRIDAERLSQLLGVPVVPTVGNKGVGMEALLDACLGVIEDGGSRGPAAVEYGHEVNQEIDCLGEAIARLGPPLGKRLPRWLAVKLIEGDERVSQRLEALTNGLYEEIQNETDRAVRAIEKHCGEEASIVIAERRYGFAAGAVKETVTLTGEARQRRTDQIDAVVCHRVFGPIILMGVVAVLFFFVFRVSDEWAWIPWFGGWVSPTGLLEWGFERLAMAAGGLRTSVPMIHSLVSDGLIGGVGGVVSFVPLIFAMFLFISALEDSGYIARVAFLMDRVFRVFGLQGKSILALIVAGGLGAGGCAAPAVMATRTLRDDKDRLITMLVAPFMNCGAKMPVYAMLIAAFFPQGRTQVMLALWAISWTVAMGAAWILRRTVARGAQTPFVMELPAYHAPTLSGVLTHTWERTWMYVKKAGTIILAINVVFWAAMYFPRLPVDGSVGAAPADAGTNVQSREARRLAYSLAGRLGTAIEPVSRIAGLDWRANVALIGGLAAKEVIVGTLGTAYSIMGEGKPGGEPAPLSARLAADKENWNALKAFALMIFVMIYSPCFVTLSVIRRESGSWKWVIFSMMFSTSIAFILATVVYQTGRILGWGA